MEDSERGYPVAEGLAASRVYAAPTQDVQETLSGFTTRQEVVAAERAANIGIGALTSKKKELLQRYSINIEFLSTGCLVKVGCKTIPFSTISETVKELNAYFEDPEKAINEWYAKFNSNE